MLLSYMKAPHSYTKEDIVEINSHSGPVLLSRILQTILKTGIRLAKPGEFTFRAFTLPPKVNKVQPVGGNVVDSKDSKSEAAGIAD